MTWEPGRAEFYQTREADLFDNERDAKLPVWAQIKLAKLRSLLLEEARSHSLTIVELERVEVELQRRV
ncbi:hypothetical protein KGG70_gp14 [Streptomyces phage Celia]|uniref:Uncharacterized protein n=1 Tax=Streptomyces phage Celia TaxID=2590946 RepID=A0A516KRF6_9CAUD|nr:hypothetical protein KGG70_gp14 [Streptomyces phage Celia]QDP44270.1 hypothetical protein SEA_CELIA_67 [Streptomyces phage Celia]QFG10532.1 hypothetical protein SEA_URZA_69 [Streptomyces phage Urza]QJD50635.1 hypothetical protein SEA_ITZA_70 [Streptomyces phage Itza]